MKAVRKTKRIKRDERWALKEVSIIIGKLMHEAQGKYTMTGAQVLNYGIAVQTVLCQIEK